LFASQKIALKYIIFKMVIAVSFHFDLNHPDMATRLVSEII